MSAQTDAKECGSEQLISKRKESGEIQKLMKYLTLNIGVRVNQMELGSKIVLEFGNM